MKAKLSVVMALEESDLMVRVVSPDVPIVGVAHSTVVALSIVALKMACEAGTAGLSDTLSKTQL